MVLTVVDSCEWVDLFPNKVTTLRYSLTIGDSLVLFHEIKFCLIPNICVVKSTFQLEICMVQWEAYPQSILWWNEAELLNVDRKLVTHPGGFYVAQCRTNPKCQHRKFVLCCVLT